MFNSPLAPDVRDSGHGLVVAESHDAQASPESEGNPVRPAPAAGAVAIKEIAMNICQRFAA